MIIILSFIAATLSGLAIGLWIGTVVQRKPVSSASTTTPDPSLVPSFRPEDVSQEALQKRREKFFKENGLNK